MEVVTKYLLENDVQYIIIPRCCLLIPIGWSYCLQERQNKFIYFAIEARYGQISTVPIYFFMGNTMIVSLNSFRYEGQMSMADVLSRFKYVEKYFLSLKKPDSNAKKATDLLNIHLEFDKVKDLLSKIQTQIFKK